MPNGSCLCGAVSFVVTASLKPADACHCRACRKVSGHFFVSTDIAKSAVNISGEDNVKWFASSEKVRRGFCSTCGTPLFFDPVHHNWIGLAMGAFDGATDTTIGLHVFVAEKGDYYTLTDGLPQNEH